jgi:hypothetical protein
MMALEIRSHPREEDDDGAWRRPQTAAVWTVAMMLLKNLIVDPLQGLEW